MPAGVAAERRVIEFSGEKYGIERSEAAMERSSMRPSGSPARRSRKFPTVSTIEHFCDDDAISDEPIKIAARVSVKGNEIEVDFAGSSPQVHGGMNAPLAVTVSATCYAIKCLTDPENAPNSGSYRPIKVQAPHGTVVNPMPPAPVIAGNHETASRIADVIIGALADALPDRVCAAGSGSSGVLSIGARMREGGRERELLMVETHGAGQGANIEGDGVNARRVSVGNTGNTPSEATPKSASRSRCCVTLFPRIAVAPDVPAAAPVFCERSNLSTTRR